MPNNNVKEGQLRIGDDWYFALTIPGVAVADPIATAYFILKPDASAADGATGSVFLTVTTALAAQGQITANGGVGTGDGTATAVVRVADTLTDGLEADTTYALALKTVTVGGVEKTPIAGTLTPLPKLVTSP